MTKNNLKKTRGILFYILISLFFYTLTLSNQIEDSKELKTGVLNNGMKYYLYKNEYPKNKIFMNLVVNSGSLEESPSEGGVAHFLEHMAFNGTKLYPKNELVKYLQSIGLKFGDDLNAYTTYDETVYSLDIPSTEDDINKSLNILNEWAFNINLNPEDVKDERNIIVEEWRLRQGLKFRISDLKKKSLFGDSLFYTRQPIGTFETINSISSEVLKSYYSKLYSPNRMAIIVVGEINPTEIEKKLRAIFTSGHTGEEIIKESFLAPETKNQTVVFKDAEIATSNLSLSYLNQSLPLNNKTAIKNILIRELFFNIFNNRINILKQSKDSPFISGEVDSYSLSKGVEIVDLGITIKDNQIVEGYKELFTLLKNLSIYPPYSDELENEKKEFISNLRFMVANKDSIENQMITEEIKETFLLGDTFLTIEEEYKLVNELALSITPGDILNFSKIFYNTEKLKFLTLSDSKNFEKITSSYLDEIEKEVSISNVPIFSHISNKELEKPVLIQGEILSKQLINEGTPFEYCEYLLSNGIKVSYKKTDFEADKIYINLFKKEGSSNLNEKEYYSSEFLPYMLSKSGVGNLSSQEFDQFLKGKKFKFSVNMEDYTHGIELISDNASLENAIVTLDSLVLSPRFDDTIFNSLKGIYYDKIVGQENSPLFQFNKLLTTTFFSNDYRRVPLTLNNLSNVDKEEIIKLYKEKFSNLYNYNLIIIGAIDEAKVEELLKKSFASLPSEKNDASTVPLNIKLQEGSISKVVTKGVDEKAKVTLLYPYKGVYNNENRNLYNGLSSLFNILLIEKIRESSAQVYSIYTSPNLEYGNFGENYLVVNFSTDYKRVDEVIKNVKNSIDAISKGEYDRKKLDDVVKNYRINYDTQLKMNEFWYKYLFKKVFSETGDYSVLTPDQFSDLMKYERVKEFASEVIKSDACTAIILKPEKSK